MDNIQVGKKADLSRAALWYTQEQASKRCLVTHKGTKRNW